MSIFTAEYWKTAAKALNNLKVLVLASLLIALSVVLSSFSIPVAENLHITFGYLVMSLGAVIYGPVVGLIVGAVSDIVGFVIHPSGMFFPGYTLSSMLGCFIYGIFFYKARITVLRIFLAKFLVNYIVNIGLGCIWSAMIMGKGYLYFFAHSIVKNTLMLPIEVFLIYSLFQILLPVLVYTGIVSRKQSKHISII
ncbi:folate family ECF transporter S component [Sporolactobacillus sp. THM19-2]|uniref:folate family ECF transporter S component n=1 Tax=Sporolactobacillus sp. THM19-2 TaxID=2511171 RepID=UPI00101FB3B5|nr:folate family ECF transporter S component [Sporolactobacillus sp. THM19-2]RYL86826.1 folate family ECF transporter S component [Sporolactobacillus sp. THM19-2]